MHRIVLDINNKNIKIDHRNCNGLNNQKANLRIVTNRQNSLNRQKRINCSSEYKGVYWNKKAKKWYAKIKINKKLCISEVLILKKKQH